MQEQPRQFRCRAAAANLLYVAYVGFRALRNAATGRAAGRWGAGYLITQFFLGLLDALGRSGVFALFAADYDRRRRAHTGS
ncbi:hypothetical protein [Micromonospora chalcea]|uniref:hypothetical protein n=1 Tax=Micromonospora chalcea TaxID=1874 RepID=UPI0033D34212